MLTVDGVDHVRSHTIPLFSHIKLILFWIDRLLRLQKELNLIQLQENGVVDGPSRMTKHLLWLCKRPLKSLSNSSSMWMELLKLIVSFVEDAKITKYVDRIREYECLFACLFLITKTNTACR